MLPKEPCDLNLHSQLVMHHFTIHHRNKLDSQNVRLIMLLKLWYIISCQSRWLVIVIKVIFQLFPLIRNFITRNKLFYRKLRCLVETPHIMYTNYDSTAVLSPR